MTRRTRTTFVLILAVLFTLVLVDGLLHGPLWQTVHTGLISSGEILIGIGLALIIACLPAKR